MTRIVWMYPELMSLYGGYAALRLLRARLEAAGEEVVVERVNEGGALELSRCSLLLISPGTERSLLAAAKDIARCRAEITEYCASGRPALLTGNAGALFGRGISSFTGETAEGLDALDMSARIIDKRRYSEFIMRSNALPGEVIGAINTSVEFETNEAPLFEVLFDAAGILPQKREGAVKGRVFATQLIGPMLARNPAVLDAFAGMACSRELPPLDAAWRGYSEAGYRSALATLKRESGAAI